MSGILLILFDIKAASKPVIGMLFELLFNDNVLINTGWFFRFYLTIKAISKLVTEMLFKIFLKDNVVINIVIW